MSEPLSSSIALDDGATRRPLKVVRLLTALQTSGPELGLLESLRHFDRTRFQFVVACLHKNRMGQQIEDLGIPVFDMRMSYVGILPGLLRLWRFLKTERPDILHTQFFLANVVGRSMGAALRVPVIISSEHSLTHDSFEGRRRTWLRSAIDAVTARCCCDRVIAVSEATKRYLVENSVPPQKIEVVLNSIDTLRFAGEASGEAVRAEFGLENAPVVTIVARLHTDKNHALLIEAFARVWARLPQARLLIVGSGSLEGELRAQAEASAPGAVVFAGARSDIPEIMAASDVVVLCSRRESFGRALAEAMASGKPVIGTAVDGIPEVLADGETGILVPPDDSAALAAAMDKLLTDRDAAVRMGLAGKRRTQKLFDIRRSVERFQTIYSELYESRSAAVGRNRGVIAERSGS